MATSTQAAPATASKVEKSAIQSGALSPTSNVGNTDNSDAIAAELAVNTNATGARITYVARTKVTGVTVSPTTSAKTVGQTQQLTPTVAPGGATIATVTYSSSDVTKATVNSSGLVTAVAAGVAVITVTTTDGLFTATHTMTVS